jgi:hypothetical protein
MERAYTIAAVALTVAVAGAGCSEMQTGLPASPSGTASHDLAAHPSGNVTLPPPAVVDAGVCGQLTLSWGNPGSGGHLAQTWHLEIWRIESGERVDPKVFNDANYALTSFTMVLPAGTYEVRINAKSSAPRVQNSANVSFYFTVDGCDRSCTYTQGYWKNHPEAWPVASLWLGGVSYSAVQLQTILQTPVSGNGLISLAHQLIAAKLNIANGADATAVAAAVADADALIGMRNVTTDYLHPSMTSALVGVLDQYNNGVIGPGHCD